MKLSISWFGTSILKLGRIMAKPLLKSRLLLGNKLLGDLFYDKDVKGRGYLKLSFKNKFTGFTISADFPTLLPVPLASPLQTKVEISYKFDENLFAVKTYTDGVWSRQFHSMSLPHSTCLFIIQIKDLHFLEDSESDNSLILNPPNDGPLAIIFSFAGPQGVPLKPPEYNGFLMGSIDIPETPLNKLWIGIARDPNSNKRIGDLSIAFPFALASV